MSTAGTIQSIDTRAEGLRELYRVYSELMKMRLSQMVVVTAAVGFVLASGTVAWWELIYCSLGVLLTAGCANALNQVLERERDALMPRTVGRPLPAGRIGVGHAIAFATVIGLAGLALLATLNTMAAALAAINIVLYVAVYTPLKTKTTLNTLVGAVVGAIPPMIGWVAVTGEFGVGAWVLGVILFAWQMPHFLALAWMYRDDYEAGGYHMLPIVDRSGRLTAMVSLMYCVALVPASLTVTLIGVTGWIYLAGALLLGGWYTACAVALVRRRDRDAARRLFIASVFYLPALLGLSVVDRSGNWVEQAAELPVAGVHDGKTDTPVAAAYDR